MAKTKSSQIKPESQSLASKILDTIAKIDRPADFCTSGQCPMMLPGLNVDGLWDIGLPLTPTEAKRMIKACRQAPYGKGTETVVDTKVRKVWELDPEQFSLKNPKWPSMLDVVLREVETNLGLPKKTLAAHLYKLLVYEKGGFFLPHRDGEKLDRMVATLVINLPSKHSGGELVVHHEDSQTTISMPGAAAGLEVDYAAFYADCQHEVKPLLSGYRLCLTYNLVLAKPRSKVSVSAPSFHEVADGLVTTLKQWSDGITEVQVPAVVKLAPLFKKETGKNRAIKNWITDIRTELESRTKSKPMIPSNWERESKLSCACADCSRLSLFLADPTQSEARFPLAKARRQHLHGKINQHQCDCTHETLRVGSPQLLVCKKTSASYDRACKVYEQDLKHLSFIQKIGLE